MELREFEKIFESFTMQPDEVALKEYEELVARDRRVIMGAVGRGTCRLFWSETQYRIKEDDVLGPNIFISESLDPIRGTAIWRKRP